MCDTATPKKYVNINHEVGTMYALCGTPTRLARWVSVVPCNRRAALKARASRGVAVGQRASSCMT